MEEAPEELRNSPRHWGCLEDADSPDHRLPARTVTVSWEWRTSGSLGPGRSKRETWILKSLQSGESALY